MRPGIYRLLKPNRQRKNSLMHRKKTWWRARWCLRQKKPAIYRIVITGGIMCMAPTGSIRRVPVLTLTEKKITRLYISQKKTRKRMQNGRAKDCQRKRNGNLQRGAGKQGSYIPGEILLN